MALLRSVLGTVTQSMGGITATTWKGKNVLKQKVSDTNTSNTPAQQEQRSKFAALATLGGLFGPAIRIGYRVAAAKVTEQNAFYTANKDAVSYANGVASVNYATLKLSTGIVGGVAGLDVKFDSASGTVTIEWDDNANGADALETDRVQFVAYNTLSHTAQVYAGTDARDQEIAATTNTSWIGALPANIRVYAFFKRATDTATSPSSTAVAHA